MPRTQRDVTATKGVPDTTGFHQLAVTKTGATVRLYLDGEDVTSLVASRTLEPAATPLLLGTGVDPLAGVLDEVSVYDKALPASAIAAHHRAATAAG